MSEKEIKTKLLESAKKEFMEKGYMHASLRSICKNAGVTTGALYFFFKDKQDLFASIVEEPLKKLYEVMNSHYMEEINNIDEEDDVEQAYSDDLEASKQIIHYMYQYYDEFLLILVKGQGSGYENCIDQFVDITERHYRRLADRITDRMKIKKLDDYTIHWIAHMHMDVFANMLVHIRSEEEALKAVESVVKYLVSGWNGLFLHEAD